MKWQGIVEFVSVAENESFTLASKKLSISTAQVSRQVSALEKRLNIKLFYRTTRKVSLTQEGQIYFQYCRNVLNALDTAEQVITNLKNDPQGIINITAPVTFGEQKILPLINNFIKQHKKVNIICHLSNERVSLIEQGFDLAIRLGKLNDSSLIAKRLSSRAHYVCASPKYIQRYGAPHSLSELSNHNCLIGINDYWRFVESGKERNIKIQGNLRCNSGAGLVDAALKNIGIVQLPDYYVESYIQSGKLVTLLDYYKEDNENVWAIYPSNQYLPLKIRLLVDYLTKELQAKMETL